MTFNEYAAIWKRLSGRVLLSGSLADSFARAILQAARATPADHHSDDLLRLADAFRTPQNAVDHIEAQSVEEHVTLAFAHSFSGLLAGRRGIDRQFVENAFMSSASSVEIYSGTRRVFSTVADFVEWQNKIEDPK